MSSLSHSCSLSLSLSISISHKHTHTYEHVGCLRRSFLSKINGLSNAANVIAAKFGAPAGTMQRDFHVISTNNWICPQFGSDEARFLPFTPSPTQCTQSYTYIHTCARSVPFSLWFLSLSCRCATFLPFSAFCLFPIFHFSMSCVLNFVTLIERLPSYSLFQSESWAHTDVCTHGTRKSIVT